MLTKKLLLCGLLATTTLCSTSSFAYYHAHPTQQPRYKHHHHHHPSPWRNSRIHRHWGSYGNYIGVQPRITVPRVHRHY